MDKATRDRYPQGTIERETLESDTFGPTDAVEEIRVEADKLTEKVTKQAYKDNPPHE